MSFLFLFLCLFNFCRGEEKFIYPSESITYAGMTIECIEGCGTDADPDLQKIWSILEATVNKTFRDVFVVDATKDGKLLESPVRCNDSGECERWNWQVVDGMWPLDKDLIFYQEVWITSYPRFLEVARALREDVRFYYFTNPRRLQEFETSLIAKLKEGVTQGYNIYRLLPGGEIELSCKEGSPLYISLRGGWEWINYRLDYLSYYGCWRTPIEESDETYRQKEEQIKRAIEKMDNLFRHIFIYCLEHHQPEGMAFSLAIESLLVGNWTEGIDQIRKLIEIGIAKQFPSEIMGKMHLLKGQLELESSLYADAIVSLTEAIIKNPDLKETYLERATAYFELGKFDHSMEDYLAFTASIHPFSTQDFSLAFAKNLITGCYESGRGLYLLLSGFAQHPIQTAGLIWESLTLLSKLAVTNEWKLLAEAIAPEVHQLLVEWDSLSSEKRGELAGYAFGKYGTDLLMPVALAKGLKCGTQVSSAYKNLRAADQALLLESLSSLKSAAEIEKVVVTARETAFLGEELGFTARKMGQLKEAGALEETIANSHELLSPLMQESVALHKKARDTLKPYVKKPMSENKVRELIHEVGMPTFPRPKGIPEDFLVMVTDRGVGMEYIHPTNNHIRVRVMPGKLHSPNLCQKKPYVIQKVEGEALDKAGKSISAAAPEAHIPVEEFIYRSRIDGN